MSARAAEGIPESEHDEEFGFLGQMEEFHPTEPHWYLPLMGVDLPCTRPDPGGCFCQVCPVRLAE